MHPKPKKSVLSLRKKIRVVKNDRQKVPWTHLYSIQPHKSKSEVINPVFGLKNVSQIQKERVKPQKKILIVKADPQRKPWAH